MNDETRVVNRDAVLARDYLGKHRTDPAAYADVLAIYHEHMGKEDEKAYHAENRWMRGQIALAKKEMGACPGGSEALRRQERLNEIYRKSLLMDAKVDFDAYCRYIESNRPPEKQFYLPRRKQLRPVVDALQGLMDDELDLLAVSLPPGCGKLLADDTPVMTRDGWKRHGDLQVGDYVVGLDGKYKRVERVFEKNVADYEVEFTNGEKIRCHGNHEWVVYDRHKSTEYKKTVIRTTKEMLEGGLDRGTPGKRGHRYFYMLPGCEAMQGEESVLPMDPYLFGAWLGDGTTNTPAVTLCNSDTVILAEFMKKYRLTHIYDQVGCKRYEFAGMRDDLHKMGLCYAHRNEEKYIPDVYMTASIRQRLELLAGLIDTDGMVCRDGRLEFSTTNEHLRQGVKDLVSGFGWRLVEVRYEPTMSSGGVQGRKVCYRIMFTPDWYIPCRVKRKQMRKEATRRRMAVKAIRKIDPEPGNCIQVEGGIYRVGRTMLPTHNSTTAIFYLTWVAGKYPEEPNLTGSHSNAFIRGVYDECLRILDPHGEYLWHDVFPELSVSNTNAKDCRIDIGKRKRFETLEFTSIGSGNAGLYRAGRLLYCDDLVSGLEVSLSKERLDKLWEVYTTDLRQRKIGDHCKELHIATRWSVHDVIGRLEDQYGDSDRAKFIVVPALDENDESNFDYKYGVGFTTAFYHEQREIMDDVSWKALYMNQPIEREGLLYTSDELQRYFELPDREPDAILCVCDTKDRGKDYCSMPIVYQYGDRYFLEDVVYDNSNPEIVEARLAEKCVKHKVHLGQFESNSAGGRVAQSVQEKIRNAGGRTKLTTKYTTANKETKIIMASPYVKEHFLFKDDSVVPDKEYRKFMNAVCSYSMEGKNKNDDAVDSLAMLAEFVQSFAVAKVQPMARPF